MGAVKRIASAATVTLSIAALLSRGAAAKGNPLAVTPDAGPAGTVVRLNSDLWQPGAPVRIYAGASASYAEPPTYAGPIATATSDAHGNWSASVRVTDVPGLTLPSTPSFVVFKATSEGTPGASSGVTEGLAYFALTVNGRRPDGAGGIDLTILGPSASAWLDWEPAGSDFFYISHVGPFGPPLRDYSIGRLTDGDWDVAVPSALVPVAATGGRVITVEATLCESASIPCGPHPGPLTVVRVSVRDGEISPATITLGEPQRRTTAPATGDGPAAPSRTRADVLIATLWVTGVSALILATMLRRRAP